MVEIAEVYPQNASIISPTTQYFELFAVNDVRWLRLQNSTDSKHDSFAVQNEIKIEAIKEKKKKKQVKTP